MSLRNLQGTFCPDFSLFFLFFLSMYGGSPCAYPRRTLTVLANCVSMMSADFKILCHHVYEFRKGLRSLVLHTMRSDERVQVEDFLGSRGIAYCIYAVGAHKINVFFGSRDCVSIVRQFSSNCLNELSAEEDFMLGIMLGYDRVAQCDRYLRRKRHDRGRRV